MATEKQKRANAENARKGKGPGQESKALTRHNAVVHGLSGESPVIPGEREEEMAEFVNSLAASLSPVGAAEHELARDVGVLSWRLRRAAKAEAGLFQQWILNDKPRRLAVDSASRPSQEYLRKVGLLPAKPKPLTEEDYRRADKMWEERKHAELGEVISIDSAGPNALTKLARYETTLSRRRDRSLAALLALQHARK